jgi:hypothetical protein
MIILYDHVWTWPYGSDGIPSSVTINIGKENSDLPVLAL